MCVLNTWPLFIGSGSTILIAVKTNQLFNCSVLRSVLNIELEEVQFSANLYYIESGSLANRFIPQYGPPRYRLHLLVLLFLSISS